MKLTALDIQQQQFPIRWRGFDTREVEHFLEQAASVVEHLCREKEELVRELQRLRNEQKGYQQREETFKRALVYSQKVVDQMKANAQKDAEVIVAEAEVKAEHILARAQGRLTGLQQEIVDLKRQRIQLETELESILSAHSRFLEIGRERTREADEEDAKVTIFKNPAS